MGTSRLEIWRGRQRQGSIPILSAMPDFWSYRGDPIILENGLFCRKNGKTPKGGNDA